MAKKQVRRANKKTPQTKSRLPIQKIVIAVLALAIIGLFIYNNFFKNNEPAVEYYTFTKDGELTFTDSTGTLKTKIDLEIADSEYDKQLGLMNRKEMKENQGMLFIFPRQDYQSFWMRNTLISLDMIFVNDHKQIVTIYKNTKILSDTSYPSSQPAMYVVEVLAGFTDRHNIQVGDKIDWMGTNLGNPK
ncbi:MAG: DUF192 domain-containing protein [Ignavibacteria bacterium]|nr:DUF192 domain-containing protein [Ignavibacteria bacterium]